MTRRPLELGIALVVVTSLIAVAFLWQTLTPRFDVVAVDPQVSPDRESPSEAFGPPQQTTLAHIASSTQAALTHAADPNEDWLPERFSASVAAQLDLLSDRIQRREWRNDQALVTLTSHNFRSDDLRPKGLATSLQDDNVGMEIRRVTPGQNNSSGIHTSLFDALQSLWKPFPGSSWVVHFKVVRVELSDHEVAADVHFHATNRVPQKHAPTGLIQQNALWRTSWTRPSDSSPPKLRRLAVEPASFEEIVATHTETLLSDCTASALQFDDQEASSNLSQLLLTSHARWTQRIESAFGMDVGAFHGLALGDADGDGLEDVYLCMPGGLPNCLLRQNADGTVTNIAAATGLDILDFTRHALFIDLDNDGDQDLPMLVNGALAIFENRAGVYHRGPTYTLQASAYSISAADIDNDRLLDLHVTGRDPKRSDGARSLLGHPVPYHDATNGGTDAMFRNQGQLRFHDVTEEVGLVDRRFSQAASWEDYDNDGDLDLYVANDFGRNALYQNTGGRFRDVAKEAGVEDLAAGMSVSWADYNRDGQMDLYVSNMFSSAGNRVAYQRNFLSNASPQVRSQFQRHARGNTLFLNTGDGSFRDTSLQTAVTMGRWAWASAFCDLNNDGWQDILVTNGFVTNESTTDL